MANSVPLEVMKSVHPHGLTNLLSAAREPVGTTCSVAGVVVEAKEPHASAKDWFVTFTLLDDSSESLPIRVFNPSKDRLPKLIVGDVVYVKDITIKMWANSVLGSANATRTQWLSFASKDLPGEAFRVKYATHENLLQFTRSFNAPDPTIHEQQWAITLSELFKNAKLRTSGSWRGTPASKPALTPHAPVPAGGINRTRKFSLIKDVQVNKFYDFTCEVIKKYWNTDFLEVYVTDYTENNMLEPKPRPSPDDLNTKLGPHGKMTLRVDLFAPHALHADKNVSEGDFVFLQNVRIKFSHNGRNLEGNIYHDSKYQTKICIWRAREEECGLEDLKSRREEYWARERNHQRPGKNKKSKRNKKDKSHATLDSAVQSEVESPPPVQDEEMGDAPPPLSKFNSNVIVFSRESPSATLGDIVHHGNRKGIIGQSLRFDFPCINARYRTSLKVVDYYPHDIRSFVQPEAPDNLPVSSPDMLERFKWHFWLVCESGEPELEAVTSLKINVLVEGEHAQKLLGPDFDATAWNIRASKDPGKASGMLSERLFLLWGELEETKRQFLTKNPQIKPDENFSLIQHKQRCDNYPFLCSLAEFGFPALDTDSEHNDDRRIGYQRIYMLVDTVLK